MIDTTKLERTTDDERIAELEQQIAELRRTVEHPALMKIIADAEHQAANTRMLLEYSAKRAAAIPRPTWTPESGTPPPETINRQELLSDEAWNVQVDATWAHHWTARDVIARSEDGSPLVELARRALLAHWRLRHIEMEMVRARSAGDAPSADMQLAYKTSAIESEHVGTELGEMLPEVANALALMERWETMEQYERVQNSAYYRDADFIVSTKAIAPFPEIAAADEPVKKKGWFR